MFAATPRAEVAGALTMYWGLTPIVTPERDVQVLERLVLERRLVPPGAIVVFVNVSADLDRVDANFLNVQKVG